MFGIERFKRLSIDRQLAWFNQANECRLANIPPTQLSDDLLCACIWMGELMLQLNQDNTAILLSEFDNFVDLHRWVISLKHEWIERESHKKGIPSFLLQTPRDTPMEQS